MRQSKALTLAFIFFTIACIIKGTLTATTDFCDKPAAITREILRQYSYSELLTLAEALLQEKCRLLYRGLNDADNHTRSETMFKSPLSIELLPASDDSSEVSQTLPGDRSNTGFRLSPMHERVHESIARIPSLRIRRISWKESLPNFATKNRALLGLVDVDDGTYARLQRVFGPLCSVANNCTCFNGSAVLTRPICSQRWAKCDQSGSLTKIDMNSCGLSGELSEEIGEFSNLTVLGLYSNRLQGKIPESIGNLTGLWSLDLSRNLFTGSIPASLGGLFNLQNLDFNDNFLSGTIPESLGRLSSLLYLYMYDNRLNGSLPDSLGNLSQLQFLDFDTNDLSGSIPSSIGNLQSLQYILLYSNRLSGAIPDTFGNLSVLSQLFLYDNYLTGGIPPSLGNLTLLTGLNLASNLLVGPLPEIVLWSNLSVLDIHNNSLNGSLSVLSYCSALEVLYVAENRFAGFVPDLVHWPELQVLAAFDNQLTGGVPTSLFISSKLQAVFLASNNLGGSLIVPDLPFASLMQQLDLTNCSLGGVLPVNLAQLTELVFLSLAHNRFTGTIPPAWGSLVFQGSGTLLGGGVPGNLNVLLLSNNMLEGELPEQILAPSFVYTSGDCRAAGAASLSVLDVSSNRLNGTLSFRGLLTTDNCGDANYAPRSLVQLVLDNNRFSGEVSSNILLPPLSILSLSNNSFSGPLPIPAPGFSAVRSLDVSNNNFSGIIPGEYGRVPVLRAIIATGNPNLYVPSCNSTNSTTYDRHCLPANFLTVNAQLQQRFDDGLVCNSVAAVSPSLTVSVDQRTYLRGVQCSCNTTSFQTPRASPEWSGAPLCVPCTSQWCDCANPGYAMTGCWAAVAGNATALSAANNASAWVALECPYVSSPSQTACRLNFSALCLPGDAACQCTLGYSNRRCSQCIPGYFESSRRCELCWPGLRVLLPIGWTLAVAIYMVYLLLVPGNASGVLKITTFYGQSLLILAENSRVPWPPAIASLLRSSSDTGSLSATALECVFSGIDLGSRFIIYTVTPVALTLVCAVIYAVNRFALRWEVSYDIFIYMMLSVLFTTYFSVTLKALAGISCTLDDGYLNAYPWIPCDTSSTEFRLIVSLSIACLLVYTLGVPTLAGYHLFRQRNKRTEERIARRLGFLFGSYRPSAFWWEYFVLLRRMLLAVAVTLIPFTRQQLSSAIVMAVLVGSVALQHAVMPFATVLENRLEQLSLYVLLMAFLGTYVVETSGTQQATLEWLPVLVVVVVAIVGIVLVFATALVLLVRVVPALATTSLGSRFVERSMTLVSLVLKADGLRERLLQPVGQHDIEL